MGSCFGVDLERLLPERQIEVGLMTLGGCLREQGGGRDGVSPVMRPDQCLETDGPAVCRADDGLERTGKFEGPKPRGHAAPLRLPTRTTGEIIHRVLPLVTYLSNDV